MANNIYHLLIYIAIGNILTYMEHIIGDNTMIDEITKVILDDIDGVITEAKVETIPEVMLVPKGIGLNSNKTANCKLGGKPNWIQSDNTPKCKKCKAVMTFIGQLASVGCKGTVNKNIDSYIFGDCGCYYVFSCFECDNDHQVIFQSY